jgi:hypothetical protein
MVTYSYRDMSWGSAGSDFCLPHYPRKPTLLPIQFLIRGVSSVMLFEGTNSSETAGASHSFPHFVSNPSFPAQSLEV